MPVVSQMSTRKIEVTSVFYFSPILADFRKSVTEATEVTEGTYNFQ